MAVPQEPVTLSPEQLATLHKSLAMMRHDINNHLSLFVAAMELLKFRPDTAEKMLATMADQPAKIIADVQKFSSDFEKAFGITRD